MKVESDGLDAPARRFAYADPPYPGQAKSRYNGSEVNLPLLIAYLDEFDGWALSTSASALREVWNLCPHARCAAWSKTWAANGWSRVRWTWEPVLFVTPDKHNPAGIISREWDSFVGAAGQNWREVRDKGGGVKPYLFVRWILDLVGFRDGDEFLDIFPGSGGVSRALASEQTEMFA